jgi:hypothetical protein
MREIMTTNTIKPVKQGKVWVLKNITTGDVIGEERPSEYVSRADAWEAAQAMWPTNSTWYGHTGRFGTWVITIY